MEAHADQARSPTIATTTVSSTQPTSMMSEPLTNVPTETSVSVSRKSNMCSKRNLNSLSLAPTINRAVSGFSVDSFDNDDGSMVSARLCVPRGGGSTRDSSIVSAASSVSTANVYVYNSATYFRNICDRHF